MGSPDQPAGSLLRLQFMLDAAFKDPRTLAEMAGEVAANQQFRAVLHELVSEFWPPQRRADFAIVGAMKAGTTALNWFLCQHPDVCTAHGKEAHYFDFASFFEHGEPNYDWYHAF